METTPEGWDMTASSINKGLEDFTTKFALRVIEQTLDESAKELPLNILEVCAGSGVLSLPLSQLLPRSHIISTDFAPKLVEIIQHKARDVKNIEAKVMDGQNLEFPDSSFDYLFNNFGVFFFPDINKGFHEMYRVLKPGGKAGFSTWSDKIFPAAIIQSVFSKLGIVPSPNALPPVITKTNTLEKITELLNDARFVDLNTALHEDFYTLEDYSQLMGFFLNNPAMISMLGNFSPERKKEFENVTLDLLKSRCPLLPAQLYSTAFIVTATKK
eukprot:TRINITY_DN878_c0_g1_i3.p2 TRINITY_DN878_c0_g1~~TRINITY_DN878_c0_g1_i3.p2  ORF type:complete len:271 (+),score=60.59 TRINITY_DN878_c0_g1_i3:2005-2817(+)